MSAGAKKIHLVVIVLAAVVVLLIVFSTRASSETSINITLGKGSLEEGLVGHWTFDGKDMVSNVADRSGNGNNGALQGQTSTTTAQGVLGQALDFDGTDDYVNVGDVDITGGITISAFVRNNTLNPAGFDTIISKRLGSAPAVVNYGFDVKGGTDEVRFYMRLSGVWHVWETTDLNITTDWSHIVVTYDEATEAKIYKDGVSKTVSRTSGSGFPTLTADNTDTYIGWWVSGDSGAEWNGLLDDVRIYNRVLSVEEITRLYDLGATTKLNTSFSSGSLGDGLVVHWTFDGKDMINNVNDSSGQGNDAVIIGQTSTTTVRGRIGQALLFDGTDDAAQTASTINLGSDVITITLWLNWDTFANNDDILLELSSNPNNNSPAFSFNPNSSTGCGGGKLSIAIHDGTNGADYRQECFTRPSAGEWHHYALVLDNSTVTGDIKLYLDNSELSPSIGFNDKSGSGNFKTDTIYLMSRAGSSLIAPGTLDDVRIYSRELSVEEIGRVYDLGATSKINTSFSSGSLDDGLVVHWTFDGINVDHASSTAEITDTSGMSNNGNNQCESSCTDSAVENAQFVRGRIGQALDFDGTDDYVGVLDNNTLDFGSGDMTLSLWAWSPDNTAGSEIIAAKIAGSPSSFAGWQIGWTVDDAFFGVSDGGSSANAAAVYAPNGFARDKEWHHWAGVYRSGTAELWIDGVLLATDTDLENYDSINTLRAAHRGNGLPFEGKIDDMRVYNRALSAEEVTRLYNLGG